MKEIRKKFLMVDTVRRFKGLEAEVCSLSISCISQGLRSWGQFRKNMFFHEKKPKKIFLCVVRVFQICPRKKTMPF